MRRGFLCLIVLSVLSVSVFTQAVPSHMNFNETSQDLYAITSFLGDIQLLCEHSLSSSLDARCTIIANQTMNHMTYSNESLRQSLLQRQELVQRISYSDEVLNKLKGKAPSYEYLKECLLPMKQIGLNISSFVLHHQHILENFSLVLDFFTLGKNESAAVNALGNIKMELFIARINLSIIEQRITTLSTNFSTEVLSSLVSQSYDVLDRYDQYSNDLVSLYYWTEPHLLLFVEQPALYLGREIQAYGYFIAARSFIPSQSVTVQLDHTLINTTITNADGLFESILPIPTEYPPGTYSLHASTSFNTFTYVSPTILITIQKIPTNLMLFSNKTHAYLREPIQLYGTLTDYTGQGIQAAIKCRIGNLTYNQTTDEQGKYAFVVQESLPFGKYPTTISFTPSTVYEPCHSRPLIIYIDTPTILSIILPPTPLPLGDTLIVRGQLKNSIIDLPLQQKNITVFINNKPITAGRTNDTGWYNIPVSTNSLHEGLYSISTFYQTDEPQWRSATSSVVQLTIGAAVFTFLPYAFIILLLLIAVVLFTLRKKIMRKQQAPQPSYLPDSQSPDLPQKPITLILDEKDFIIDTTGKKADTFHDAIISRYHSFIARLSTAGLSFPRSATHLDIQQQMINQGFSPQSTETITTLFEQAMYSPFPLGKKEVTTFNHHIRKLIKNIGGTP